MIVFYDECQTYNQPNSLAPNFFRLADDADALAGLPLRLELDYYFADILGVPKNFLCLLRSALPVNMSPAKMNYFESLYGADNIVKRLGSLTTHLGFNYGATFGNYSPFIPYTPDNGIGPADVAVYSPETRTRFQFSGPPVPAWQLQFGRKFTALARQYGVKLVLLHFPHHSDAQSTVIKEREFWPDALRADITMVGIPPATLFQGMSDEDVYKLYMDNFHLNKNGQAYYTSLITPALLQIYATLPNH